MNYMARRRNPRFRRRKRFNKKRNYHRNKEYYDGGFSNAMVQNKYIKVHDFIVSDFDDAILISDPTAEQMLAISFQMNAIPGYADFTALYHEYRIAKVELTFQSVCTQTMTGSGVITGTVLNQAPIFRYAVDTLDNTAPANMTALLDFGSCHNKVVNNNAEGVVAKIVVYPKVRSGLLEDGGTIVSSGSFRSPWISTTRVDIPHFGLKCGLGPTGTGGIDTAWRISLFTRIHLQCRSNYA